MPSQQSDRIVTEFTRQAAAFNVAPVMRSAETLQALIDLAPAGGAWAEVACGPGLIARGLAAKVGRVIGVDLTQAMLDLGQQEAAHAGLTTVAFTRGDALRLPFADGALDGAVTRFSLHHIPAPGRCVAELARVVRPGGWVLIGDHVTSADGAAAAWHQEIERLRDPSHWASLTPAMLHAHCERAGLRPVAERVAPFTLDYEEWLTRGSDGPTARAVIDGLLAERPEGSEGFHVSAAGGARTLHLRYWLALWQRPV